MSTIARILQRHAGDVVDLRDQFPDSEDEIFRGVNEMSEYDLPLIGPSLVDAFQKRDEKGLADTVGMLVRMIDELLEYSNTWRWDGPEYWSPEWEREEGDPLAPELVTEYPPLRSVPR